MIVLPVLIGVFGIIAITLRPSVLGVLIGFQLATLGGALFWVMAGRHGGAERDAQAFGLFIVIAGLAQLVAGYCVAVRLFYLHRRAQMDDLHP